MICTTYPIIGMKSLIHKFCSEVDHGKVLMMYGYNTTTDEIVICTNHPRLLKGKQNERINRMQNEIAKLVADFNSNNDSLSRYFPPKVVVKKIVDM